MSEETITVKKETLWKYSTFILAALLIIGAFVFIGNDDGDTTARVVQQQEQQLPAQQEQSEIPISDADPQIGKADAPVTIVEFSDFSCPYCGAASGKNQQIVDYMKSRSPSWEPAIPGIIKNYVESGKVRLVFKYFPGHGSGQQAQLVGWCLNEQNKELFWKFHDEAFAVQDSTNDLTKMKELAQKVGADMGKLNSCLTSKKYDSKLNTDTQVGQSAGVQGTPAFFVNGKLVSGAQPYSVFQQEIESALK